MAKQASSTKGGKAGKGGISRRNFLKVASTAIAAAGTGLAGCESVQNAPSPGVLPHNGVIRATEIPILNQYPEVPYPADEPVETNMLSVLTPHEALTIDALTGRILPGTPDDPGAREAGVVNFIDKMLTFNEGFVEATYRQPPFAQTYEGDAPPADNNTYQTVWVKKDELSRYGFQAIHSPRERYRIGIAALDQYSNSKFQKQFAQLTEDQQDQIVDDLANDKATGFDQPSAKDFFTMVRNDTINGMFSDPAYGGNRDLVGWKLIGYPGAQRAYTSTDIKTEGNTRPPQSLAMMHHFHPGQPANNDVFLPVSGSDEHRADQMSQPMNQQTQP